MHSDGLGLRGILSRLEELIDEESLALRMMRQLDMRDFNHRKGLALVDLTRAERMFRTEPRSAELQAHLDRLKAKLQSNQMLLEAHLKAAIQITTMIVDAVRQEESDGTYRRVEVRGR